MREGGAWRRPPAWAVLGGVLLAATAARMLILRAGRFDLAPEEAQYWDWSRRPALAYYSKGPLVAWLIRLLTWAGGDNALAVRGGALVLAILTSLLFFELARRLTGRTGDALLLTALLQVLPLFVAGSMVLTTDILMACLWAGACLALWLGLRSGRGAWFAAAGAVTGLGLLSRYTMLLLPLSLAVYLGASRPARERTGKRGALLYVLPALAAFLPLLVWNAGHDWVTVRHVLGQGGLRGSPHPRPGLFLEFVASQAGVLTPPLFLWIAAAFWSVLRNGEASERAEDRPPAPVTFAFWMAVPTIALYVVVSFLARAHANWTGAAWITAVPAAWIVARRGWGGRHPRLLAGLVALTFACGAGLSMAGTFPESLGIAVPRPADRLRGWADLGRAVTEARRGLPEDSFVFTGSYQVAAEVAFYARGHPRVHCVNLGRRLNQYDLWPGMEEERGRTGLFIQDEGGDLPAPLAGAFGSCETVDRFRASYRGETIREFTFWRCGPLLALPSPPTPPSY